MDLLNVIFSRRSIRKFTGEIISDSDLSLLLKAGFQAPSAHNTQPWEFIVLNDKDILEEITAKHPYGKMLPDAGCAILVCGNNLMQKTPGFLIADCSAAIQNILLAAHALNLGAVWCGIYPITALINNIRKLLNLPDNIIPVGVVAVGHKAEDKKPRDNYSLEKVHYNGW